METKLHLLLFFIFINSLFSPTTTTTTTIDFDALQAFKSSVYPSTSLSSSWTHSTNPCTANWLGVNCTNNRVTRLVLDNLNLTGPIDSLLHLDQLRLFSIKNNNLYSKSPLNFSLLKNIKLLYLSHNDVSGNFPSGVAQLRRLRRLDISHNHFSGHIPIEVYRLPHLVTLRLEHNSLTGSLPNLDFSPTLFDFNVSDNNLVGEIPKFFSVFPLSAFAKNTNLCGRPLMNNCSRRVIRSDPMPVSVSDQEHRTRLSRRTVITIVVVADFAVLLLIVFGFVYCVRTMRRKNYKLEMDKKWVSKKEREREVEEEELVFFEGCKGFRVEDLLKASAEMLGKGVVGTSYKVVMEENGGERVVVVKRVREKMTRKMENYSEIGGLMREIGGLRDGNVVSLRAYYCSREEILLVSDFLPNGSLHWLLHGNRGPGRVPLDWTTRLKLASGSAKGLAFLHGTCKSKLCHGRLTSLNILVDQNGNACVSDFALYQLLSPPPPPSSSSSSSLLFSDGYMAPELLNNTRKISQRCDIYSFGVVLLEILTGKMAGDGDRSLVKWVKCVVRDEWTSEVFDIELLRYKEMEEEMVALLQVALLCLVPVPKERPKMTLVYKMIEDIRVRGCKGGTHSPSINGTASDSSPSTSEDTPTFTSN